MTKTEWKSIRGSGVKPDHIMLSVKGDASSQMAVTWRTDKQITNGYVWYKKADSDEAFICVPAQNRPFTTDVDDSVYHFAVMQNLQPRTAYEYYVGEAQHLSEHYRFTTAKKNCDDFTFLCLSDIQTGGPTPPADYTVLGQVVKDILKKHPEIEFILTAGDNTNCGQTDVQWTGLMDGLRDIISTMPFMMCMGNHDDMGFADYFTFEGKYYSEHATYFTNQFYGSYNFNGPKGWEIANYSFDYGNAHFSVLGTSGYREMNEWLIQDAQSSKQEWKFGVHHFPVCYSGPAIECNDTYPALRNGMELCDLVFSGHEHSFARSYPRRKDGLYDKPSQGTIHYNIGSGNRNPPGTRVVPKVWNCKTYCHEEELSMYSLVHVSGKKCTLTAYVEDGRIVDECIINKETDTIYPHDLAPVYNRPRLKFKGYDLGMCTERTLPVLVENTWYIAPGKLISFLGADVSYYKGGLNFEIYGKTVVCTENSNILLVNGEPVPMRTPCLRLTGDQLYVPVEDFCKPLRMTPYYFSHNNFITVESDTEAIPMPFQP